MIISYLPTGSVSNLTLLLTLNGAIGETITITSDKINDTVTLDSSGVGSYILNAKVNDAIMFSGSISGYVKSVTINNRQLKIVNVMPDGALYWYGNERNALTGGLVTSTFDAAVNSTGYQKLTNYIHMTPIIAASPRGGSVITDKAIDLNLYSKLNAIVKHNTIINNEILFTALDKNNLGNGANATIYRIHTKYTDVGKYNVSFELTSKSEEYVGYRLWTGDGTTSADRDVDVYAIYLSKDSDNIITINGAAKANITVTDVEGTSFILATDTKGKVLTENVLKSGKQYTFVDSVSGYAKTVTVDANTTEINVMPDGALYWYGNLALGGGFTNETYKSNSSTGSLGTMTYNTNSVTYSTQRTTALQGLRVTNLINLTGASKINWKITSTGNMALNVIKTYTNVMNNWESLGGYDSGTNVNPTTISYNIQSGATDGYVLFRAENQTDTIHAIWLE